MINSLLNVHLRLRQLTRCQLTHRVARSVCDSGTSCHPTEVRRLSRPRRAPVYHRCYRDKHNKFSEIVLLVILCRLDLYPTTLCRYCDRSSVWQSICLSVCRSVCLFICLCVRTITFEQNYLWPGYLAWWFTLILSRSGLFVKIIGSRSQDENWRCLFYGWKWRWKADLNWKLKLSNTSCKVVCVRAFLVAICYRRMWLTSLIVRRRSRPSLRAERRLRRRQRSVRSVATSSRRTVASCSAGWRHWRPPCCTICGRASHARPSPSWPSASSRSGSPPTPWPISSTSSTSASRREPGTSSAVWSSTTCVVWRCATSARGVSSSMSSACCRSTSSSCRSDFTRCCALRASSRPTGCFGSFTWSRREPSFRTSGASSTSHTCSSSAATGSPPSTSLSRRPVGSAATGATRLRSATTPVWLRSTSGHFTGQHWPSRPSEICRRPKQTGSEC